MAESERKGGGERRRTEEKGRREGGRAEREGERKGQKRRREKGRNRFDSFELENKIFFTHMHGRQTPTSIVPLVKLSSPHISGSYGSRAIPVLKAFSCRQPPTMSETALKFKGLLF